MPESSCIALLTDFGTSDSFVAEMKAAMLSINPKLKFVDISHHVPPADVREAAYLLWRSHSLFPRGTIFVCVVDPGVGTDRKIILAIDERYKFIAPDNGLLSMVFTEGISLRNVTNFDYMLSTRDNTFDGRDVMGPVGAYLSLGVDPESVGEEISQIDTFEFPIPVVDGNQISGNVISIDRFGNVISNISSDDLADFADKPAISVRIGTLNINGLSTTFNNVPQGLPVAYIGSCGLLEIGFNRENLAEKTNVAVGDLITVARNEH